MNGHIAQENTPRLLVLSGTREFNRSFEELRGWGYEVTEAQDPAGLADADPGAFDLIFMEIGPDPAALFTEAMESALSGLCVLCVTPMEAAALDRFLSLRGSAPGCFAAILRPPAGLDRLVFAIEEVLARQDDPAHIEAYKQRGQGLPLRRRRLEAGRLSAFLSGNAGRNFLLDFQPDKFSREEDL